MKKETGSGVGLYTVLTVVFVVLKLCHLIDWSWWRVLSPLWIPWAVAFVVMGLTGAIVVAAKVISHTIGGK